MHYAGSTLKSLLKGRTKFDDNYYDRNLSDYDRLNIIDK